MDTMTGSFLQNGFEPTGSSPVDLIGKKSLVSSTLVFKEIVERLSFALAIEVDDVFFESLVSELARYYPASQILIAAFENDFDMKTIKVIANSSIHSKYDTLPFDPELFNKLQNKELISLNWQESLEFRSVSACATGSETDEILLKSFCSKEGYLLGFMVFRFSDCEMWRWQLSSLLKTFSSRIASELERRLKDSNSKILSMAFETNDGVIITDPHRRILKVNDAFVNISGFESQEVIGHSINVLYNDKKCIAQRWQAVADKGRWQGEVIQNHKTGEQQHRWESINSVCNSNNEISYYVINFEDISDRKIAQEKIQNLANFDVLTGLPNRRMFTEVINSVFEPHIDDQEIGALLFIDLDHFKNINDSLGHAAGDWILKRVAERLKKLVREGDLLARLGGDEFVLMLPKLSGNAVIAEQQALQIGKRLIKDVSVPYPFENQTLHIGASVGISLFPGKEQKASDLLKQADTAMYHAKAAGRKTVVFFDNKMQLQADKRLRVYSELTQAIANDELVVHYQPQHMIDSKELVGVEALVRWQPVGRMMVSPAEFIPIAEETDLIIDIGFWVLNKSCNEFVAMRKEGTIIPQLSVNVSAKQFHCSGFVDSILTILDETGMDPTMLNLEITESVVLGNAENAIYKMEQLRELGISFAIDDFGAGYSSLSYLKRLPADELKIDRSFIKNIPQDRKNMTIVEAVLAMARHLGFNVTAEGVETRQQLEFLRQLKCNFYQGYLASKPVSARDLARYLQKKSESRF